MNTKDSELISIIMLSKNNGKNVLDSVRSVQAQTYTNWELLFVDDHSEDDTISNMMAPLSADKRINVSSTVNGLGIGANRLSAITQARGRWLAFLDTGDLWESTKLEHQLAFMKANGYGFTYTNYMIIDEKREVKYLVSGPEVISRSSMKKCCWPGCLTVMCESDLINPYSINVLNENNDYALWLRMSKVSECHLLNECLASNRANRAFIKRLPMLSKLQWRYEVYRKAERMGILTASFMGLRNMY